MADKALRPVQEVLSNILIVKKLYQYLDNFNDHKSFRLVNRLWRKETLNIWRNSATLRIVRNNNSDNGISFNEFVQLFYKDADGNWAEDTYEFIDYPFQKFNIEQISLPLQQDQTVEASFFSICGPKMTSLKICYGIFSSGSCPEIFHWVLMACGNLKEVDISGISSSACDSLWGEITFPEEAIFPNLTKLSFRIYYDPRRNGNTRVFTFEIRENPMLLENAKTMAKAGIAFVCANCKHFPNLEEFNISVLHPYMRRGLTIKEYIKSEKKFPQDYYVLEFQGLELRTFDNWARYFSDLISTDGWLPDMRRPV